MEFKKTRINFNKNFYFLEAIEQAIKDYCEVCSGKVDVLENNFLVELTPKTDVDSKFLSGEFSNYVLSILKNKGLV
jgi:hypothetical protein